MKFVLYNANPKGRKTCDCVIRAISTATNNSYESIYKELFETSLKTGYMLNEKRVEEKVLEAHGFIKHKQPRKLNGNKYTIGEIRNITNAKIVVISCAHHLTCVIDDELLDLWDCRFKTIGNFYTLE